MQNEGRIPIRSRKSRTVFSKVKTQYIWLLALVLLAISNPAAQHYTICLFKNLGFENCWGCGLGRSISYLFRLDFKASFAMHPLGIPVLLFLIYQIFKSTNTSK